MPSVNIYTSKDNVEHLEEILPGLREFTAEQLSCGDRALDPNEMSLRVLIPEAGLPIADTELEIMVYSYGERVENQDKICADIRKYLEKECPKAGSYFVWLQLSELGHSLEE